MEFGNRKNLIIALVLLAVLIVGGLFAFNRNGDDSENEEAAVELREGEVEIRGKIACLPYKTARENQECVKGISADGKIYAIDSAEVGFIENEMEEGTEVRATGEMEPADTQNQESSVFSYDGLLILSSLSER